MRKHKRNLLREAIDITDFEKVDHTKKQPKNGWFKIIGDYIRGEGLFDQRASAEIQNPVASRVIGSKLQSDAKQLTSSADIKKTLNENSDD